MKITIKKIEETDEYVTYSFTDEMLALVDKATDKYVKTKKGEVADVKIKEGILKFKKGNFNGIDGTQTKKESIIKPIKFTHEHVLERYAGKIGVFIMKYFTKHGKFPEEEGFCNTSLMGEVYIQDLEDGDIILLEDGDELLGEYIKQLDKEMEVIGVLNHSYKELKKQMSSMVLDKKDELKKDLTLKERVDLLKEYFADVKNEDEKIIMEVVILRYALTDGAKIDNDLAAEIIKKGYTVSRKGLEEQLTEKELKEYYDKLESLKRRFNVV